MKFEFGLVRECDMDLGLMNLEPAPVLIIVE